MQKQSEWFAWRLESPVSDVSMYSKTSNALTTMTWKCPEMIEGCFCWFVIRAGLESWPKIWPDKIYGNMEKRGMTISQRKICVDVCHIISLLDLSKTYTVQCETFWQKRTVMQWTDLQKVLRLHEVVLKAVRAVMAAWNILKRAAICQGLRGWSGPRLGKSEALPEHCHAPQRGWLGMRQLEATWGNSIWTIWTAKLS